MLGMEESRRRQHSEERQHDFMFKVPEMFLGTYCVSGTVPRLKELSA